MNFTQIASIALSAALLIACGPGNGPASGTDASSNATDSGSAPTNPGTDSGTGNSGMDSSTQARVDAGPPAQCSGPVEPENTLAACSDGCSNDDDGTNSSGQPRVFVDCDDYDCCDVVACPADSQCGMRNPSDAGTSTPAAPACDGAMAAENTLAACTDGCSNDGDSWADCADRDCCPVLTDCPAETECWRQNMDAGMVDKEDSIEQCTDGVDNDGDGFADCADFDCCSARAMAEAGGMPACARPANMAANCGCGCVCNPEMGYANRAPMEMCGNTCDDNWNGYPDDTDFACRN